MEPNPVPGGEGLRAHRLRDEPGSAVLRAVSSVIPVHAPSQRPGGAIGIGTQDIFANVAQHHQKGSFYAGTAAVGDGVEDEGLGRTGSIARTNKPRPGGHQKGTRSLTVSMRTANSLVIHPRSSFMAYWLCVTVGRVWACVIRIT